MTTAIGNDAAPRELPAEMSEDEAAEELLRRFLPNGADAEEPSAEKTDEEKKKKSADPADEAEEETSEETPEDEAEDEDGEEEKVEKKYAEDDVYLKIKVDGEEKEVPVKDLKRLWGQEAALTKKSQEAADVRKAAEAETAKNVAVSTALLERARERFKPYAELDFNLLASQVGKSITAEEYQSIRQTAKDAYEDVAFLEKNVDGFMSALQEKQQADFRTRAVECLKVLQDPEKGIEGWNEKLYDEVRSFAVSQGAPADVINQIVDPWAIKLLHNAMLYARGKDKAQVKTVKVNKTPKKIIKTTNSPAASRSGAESSADVKKAHAKLRSSGTTDDAAELLMARWAKESD